MADFSAWPVLLAQNTVQQVDPNAPWGRDPHTGQPLPPPKTATENFYDQASNATGGGDTSSKAGGK